MTPFEPSEELRNAIVELDRAIAFLDQCKASPEQASAAGCFRDAREWIDETSRAVVQAARSEGMLP